MAQQQDEKLAIFETICPDCHSNCITNMMPTEIPFFKKVIIMSTNCDSCGAKSTEVKPSAYVAERGIKFTLKLADTSDLGRDVLKSDYATLEIPEIDFYMSSGTLSGKITTLEGMLKDCYCKLSSILLGSDDIESLNDDKRKVGEFLIKLRKIYAGEMLNVTVIIDDPSGNSYLQNIYAPDVDPNLTIEEYERDDEQKDLLGIINDDINVEAAHA